ncbi:MAG: hypothetical protein ACLRXP_06905 [Oscillospiraceae bacterium]
MGKIRTFAPRKQPDKSGAAVLRIRHAVRGSREAQPAQLPQQTPLPQIAADDGK